jgi:alpha-L-fucosidase
VALAKEAGVKYLVLTAKHCDGFLLWHSKSCDYNIGRSPFKRDICAELAKAARAERIRIGWYFSPMDWRDPDFRTDRNAAFLGRMQAQLREVLSNYGRIDLLWFDWDGHQPLYDQAKTYGIVKALQPRIIINNRLDLGKGDSNTRLGSADADYYTPEQTLGGYDDQHPWESCMTVSRSGQWAWGGPQDGVKPFRVCLEMLIRCVGGDGNLLLNVGPTATGEIALEQAERLRQMGAWLRQNGQSIYGTRGGPFKPGSYGCSTRKGKSIYLHILDWSKDPVRLPLLGAKVKGARLLAGGKVEARQTTDAIEISVKEKDRQLIDTVIELKMDRDVMGLPAVDVPGQVRPASATPARQ